jgi:hypothetical protein
MGCEVVVACRRRLEKLLEMGDGMNLGCVSACWHAGSLPCVLCRLFVHLSKQTSAMLGQGSRGWSTHVVPVDTGCFAAAHQSRSSS